MQKVAIKCLFLSLMALLVMGGTDAIAQVAQIPSGQVETKASITKITGEVLIYKNGSTTASKAKVGDAIAAGDKIETKTGATTEIKTANDNAVNLQQNSNLKVEKLTVDNVSGEYENIFGSDNGTLEAIVKKLKGKSKFQIKTPTAICGARGTVFVLVITAGETRVFAVEGTVGMENPGTGQTFVVSTNMAAVSNIGGTVTELTGAEKDAIIASYNAFVLAGGEAKDISATPSPVQPPPTPERVESSTFQ